ncbi:hypothetical protein [Motilimonas pumila]|uniref:Glycoside hydrolase family 19 catalytic domain-containing protein n=1 Tax=Motilimonas pumila TaxID=2303987 RepID=A0A418YD95_9GAMM|nr:hypothetical protein [Motilimonas pumila]RJG42494.1 hypothetical protein D1Z90_12555 [Motilimonas pumila]
MPLDISQYSAEQKYDFLKHLVDHSQQHFGHADEANYQFKTADGQMNLIALRGFKNGKPCSSNNQEFDDTLFVAYQQAGAKQVQEFKLSTEFGNAGTGLLMPGQHRYYLNFHKKTKPHQSLANANTYPSGKKYRALNPYGTGVEILRDLNRDFSKNSNEQLERSQTHNLHYGGNSNNPQSWSEGCQVIQGWDNYKALIKLLESDHTIFGTATNELSDVNSANDGERPLIYTLLETQEPTQKVLITRANKATTSLWYPPLRNMTLKQLCTNNIRGDFGHYLIAHNRHWHGGVHFSKNKPVQAIAPGKLIAYRLATENQHHFYQQNGTTKSGTYSNSFVLLKHEIRLADNKTLSFFSLYMHLQPANAYQNQLRKRLPPFLLSQAGQNQAATISTKEDVPQGLNLRDIKTGAIKMVAPYGAKVTLDTREVTAAESAAYQRKAERNRHYHRVSFIDHEGKQHQNLYALLDATRARQDNSEFIISTQEDTLTSAQKRVLCGLNMRSEKNYQASTVMQVIPHGTEINIQILDSRWAKVSQIAGQAVSEQRYISYADNITLADETLDQSMTDKVVCLDNPLDINAGDTLGYPGDNLLQRHCIHFEIFCDESIKSCFEQELPPALQNVYRLQPNSTLYDRNSQSAVTERAELPQFAQINISQSSDKQYAKITLMAYAAIVKRSDLKAWNATTKTYQGIGGNLANYPSFDGNDVSNQPVHFVAYNSSAQRIARSQQGDYRLVTLPMNAAEQTTFWIEKEKITDSLTTSVGSHGTFLNQTLTGLHSQDPECYSFSETDKLSQSHPAYFAKSKCQQYKDQTGVTWVNVNLPSKTIDTWCEALQQMASNQDQAKHSVWLPETALESCSSLNFPGFQLLEQEATEPYLNFDERPEQGYFHQLLESMQFAGNVIDDEQALADALADKSTVERLSRNIVKHPTEWLFTEQKWQHLTDLIDDEQQIENAKTHIKNLSWWDQVPAGVLPDAEAVYHIHPLAFCTMLNLVESLDLIDSQRFLTLYKEEFGAINNASEANIISLTQALNQYYQTQDKLPNIHHLAYMLATGRKEAYNFLQREYFSEQPEVGNQAYFNKYDPVLAATPQLKQRALANGNTKQGDGFKYRGRGMVHLTWRNNYQKAADALKIDFVNQPELAGQHLHAVKIMVWGMAEGTFTGKKLSDYIHSGGVDYVNARRIINGRDCAQEIANDATKFERILTQASRATKQWPAS